MAPPLTRHGAHAALARMAAVARRAGRLPLSSWAMLARVLPVLAVVRVALWVLPYRTVVRLFDVSPASLDARPRRTPRRATALIRTVAWAGRRLLADRPCLTQAIACRWLLARFGYYADLRLGARRAAEGPGIEAHAWLEIDGKIVLGGGDSAEAYAAFRPSRERARDRAVAEAP